MQEGESAVDFTEGDSLIIDFDNVEDSGFEMLPKGMYPAVVDDIEFRISQSGGNPMWSFTFEVEDGEYAGRKLFTHMVFAGPGLGFTKRQLGRLAPELMNGGFDPQDPEIMATLQGRRARVKVDIQKYQGEDRNQVRDVFGSGDDDDFT